VRHGAEAGCAVRTLPAKNTSATATEDRPMADRLAIKWRSSKNDYEGSSPLELRDRAGVESRLRPETF
jgi:hypothetical protein